VFTPALLYSSSISIHPTSNYSHRNMKTIQDASKAAQLDLIMSALLDAPEELLDAITTHLAQSDVLSLALTCKALWRSTSPRIFRAISMTWDANEIRPSAPRITSLLRALVKCPRNAARIEHVELQACNFEPYGDREDEAGGRPANCRAYRLLASDRPAFERDLTRMGLGNVDAWMSAIFVENCLRALMAVLLMRCTRLKSLNIASELFLTVFPDPGTWLPSMLDHCLSAPASSDRGGLSCFDRLTSVVITGPTTDVGRKLPPDLIRCLFRMPSLVALDVACCPDLSTGINEDVRPEMMAGCIALNRLAVLKLPLTPALPRTLKALIRFTPNLKKLVYDALIPAGSFPNDDLVDALATAPETLEELTIRVHMYVRGYILLADLTGTVHGGGIGALQRLHSLRSLTIPLALLFGHEPHDEVVPQLADVLPSSLESLHLVGDLTGSDNARMFGERAEAILRYFLAGQERADRLWNHRCWSEGCDFVCLPVWVHRAAPRWKSHSPHLKRIALIESVWGNIGGEAFVIEKDRCEALNELMSGQGLEVVHVEVDDYENIRFE
jgi:hypothetical protein